MRLRKLGETDFTVSAMCFGTLTMGPLQKGLPVADGSFLLRSAYDLGVNFYDTAELYGNYEYIKRAQLPKGAVISTKCYAYDAAGAEKSLHKYLKETGRERAEIFMLHEQESELTLRGHSEAIEYFLKQKQAGLIGAFGVSTHCVACVRASLDHSEIEVVHPLINLAGIGIVDGTRQEMESAIAAAAAAGKGIYAMKPLGGGHLIGRRDEALKYASELPGVTSVAIGVADIDELTYNAAYFAGEAINDEAVKRTLEKQRKVVVQYWCEACGACIAACKSGALSMANGKVICDDNKCVYCGYCGAACKNGAIKVF